MFTYTHGLQLIIQQRSFSLCVCVYECLFFVFFLFCFSVGAIEYVRCEFENKLVSRLCGAYIRANEIQKQQKSWCRHWMLYANVDVAGWLLNNIYHRCIRSFHKAHSQLYSNTLWMLCSSLIWLTLIMKQKNVIFNSFNMQVYKNKNISTAFTSFMYTT